MAQEQTVDELLEQAEQNAAAKDAARNARRRSDDLVPILSESRDPRLNGRNGKDKYADERAEHDTHRSHHRGISNNKSTDLPLRPGSSGSLKSANGSASSRNRDRSRSPRRESRDRARIDDRGLNRDDEYPDRHRGGDDRYRPQGSRGGYRGERDRSRPRSSHNDRPSRGSGYRDREDARGYGGGRRGDRSERRSSPPRQRRARTPEPTDDERDRRTVFVQQLAARLRTKDLKSFFEQVGPVVDAQIVKDRVSGRSKGVGYVEFKDEDSVQKAIQLTGQKLVGIPIIAQLTEAEKNRQARTTEGTATQSNGVPFHRLYVGNIHFSITEEDLKNVFEPFGELEFVQLQKEDIGGRSKGYGFVQFIDANQAKEALEKMNGFELASRPIRVGLGNDKFTPESTQSLLQRFGSQAQQAQFQGSQFSGMGGRGSHAGGTGNFDRASGRDAEKAGGASALDDTDVAGVNFSNYSRDLLMRKLARTDEPEPKVAPKTVQKKAAPVNEPAASRCILIKNVYTQATKAEPNWQEEVKEDITTECNDKYGHVMHVGLALDNNDGEVYVKFDRVQGGENAFRGLNGRMFDGRMLTAQYVVDAIYNMNFPRASNV